jgi:hypothetical protein
VFAQLGADNAIKAVKQHMKGDFTTKEVANKLIDDSQGVLLKASDKKESSAGTIQPSTMLNRNSLATQLRIQPYRTA